MVQPYEPEMDGQPRTARAARIAADAAELMDQWQNLDDPYAAAIGRIRALLTWFPAGSATSDESYRALRDGVDAAVKAADHLLARRAAG